MVNQTFTAQFLEIYGTMTTEQQRCLRLMGVGLCYEQCVAAVNSALTDEDVPVDFATRLSKIEKNLDRFVLTGNSDHHLLEAIAEQMGQHPGLDTLADLIAAYLDVLDTKSVERFAVPRPNREVSRHQLNTFLQAGFKDQLPQLWMDVQAQRLQRNQSEPRPFDRRLMA